MKRTKKIRLKGRYKTWAKRSFNSGPSKEGMEALYADSSLGLRHGALNLKKKGKPHTIQQRNGKPFNVAGKVNRMDQHGNFILEEVLDPVDPKIRVDELRKVIRQQGSRTEHWMWIFLVNEELYKVRHYWFGNEHFLEEESMFSQRVRRSRIYVGRKQMLADYFELKLQWNVVKRDQLGSPPS